MDIKLILTPSELLIIQEGLLELPGKKCLKILNKINEQTKEQLTKEEIKGE